jgi:hypothetical protein
MIEADAIVLKDFHLELVVVIIVAVLIPDVLGAVQDLILVRQVVRDQAIEDDDEVDAELTPKDVINQQSAYLKVSIILTIPSWTLISNAQWPSCKLFFGLALTFFSIMSASMARVLSRRTSRDSSIRLPFF